MSTTLELNAKMYFRTCGAIHTSWTVDVPRAPAHLYGWIPSMVKVANDKWFVASPAKQSEYACRSVLLLPNY